jgi:hypothetical protein
MDKTNSSWLKTFSIGFSIISFGITIAIIGYIVLTTKQNQTTNQPPPTPLPSETLVKKDDEIANWKTHNSTDGKYSIKYPNGYLLEETDSIKTANKFPAGKKQIAVKPSDNNLNFIIYIKYYPVPDLSQANAVMQQVSGCDEANEQRIKHAPKRKDFTLDNQKAIMYEDSLCAQFVATNFYILYNDRVYHIHVASTEEYSLHKTIVDQILSTFRFTSP